MRTRTLYIMGGSASGKSTAMDKALGDLDAKLGPLEVLHERYFAERKRPATVRLRGHRFGVTRNSVYLGKMRKDYPGSDGLDKASVAVLGEWLEVETPEMLLSEGILFSTPNSLEEMHSLTDLTVLYLSVSPEEQTRRLAARGSSFDMNWVKASNTRAANAADWCRKKGVRLVENDYPLAMSYFLGIM